MSKRELFERALADYYEVNLGIVRAQGVDVPESIWRQGCEAFPHFSVLAYGLDMSKAIPDLQVTDAGISATLSFDNVPIKTFVPWEAVITLRGLYERPKQGAQLKSV